MCSLRVLPKPAEKTCQHIILQSAYKAMHCLKNHQTTNFVVFCDANLYYEKDSCSAKTLYLKKIQT